MLLHLCQLFLNDLFFFVLNDLFKKDLIKAMKEIDKIVFFWVDHLLEKLWMKYKDIELFHQCKSLAN